MVCSSGCLYLFVFVITHHVNAILIKQTAIPALNGRNIMIPASKEIFSVAPMMAHTNRHYHYFFRLLSSRSYLYTEMIPAAQIVAFKDDDERIEELLRINPSVSPSHVTLQLGGNDADILAQASRIGASWGYNAINLNCGCPSNAVSGRCGGASLMKEPERVARLVDAMYEAIPPDVDLSVKHRLSTADALTYDAKWDREQNDDDAFRSCLEFAQAVTKSGAVKKLQIHARLALLGDDLATNSTLWVPQNSKGGEEEQTRIKIDHKREQYKALKYSRSATIKNRSVPPLRPNVIHRIADALPHVDLVTNGGIGSLQEIPGRLSRPGNEQDWQKENNNVIGAMVGRAVINHPCSFSTVDELWGINEHSPKTRREVLETFAEYCAEEEERLGHWKQSMRETLRRRLVAVPFALFWGEDGNNAYQRRIRKLAGRPQRHSASSILKAALAEVPISVQEKPVSEYSLYEAGETYHHYNARSGPLQRSIL
mmetsp:Transcript_1293/g.1963  ORF Transcript_1293/g.1963 Transcript_1293/m.1963 type:complete len:484 (-) Transcript_1293:125-1576(-)